MKKALMVGAVAALGIFGFGCQNNRTPANDNAAGTGGSGYTTGTQQQQTTQTPRLGDGKIGNNNGVIDDGEGPLEGNGKSDDKIGDQPGVWNDGEGPIESTPLNRKSDSGKSFDNNAGQNDNAADSNPVQQNQ